MNVNQAEGRNFDTVEMEEVNNFWEQAKKRMNKGYEMDGRCEQSAKNGTK